MSAPVSATITCATFSPTPGMVCSSSIWCGHGRHSARDRGVELGQRLLDQLEPIQDRPGQLGVVGVEVSLSAWARSGILRRIWPLAISASTRGSVSPSIIARSIARADTVFSDDATVTA